MFGAGGGREGGSAAAAAAETATECPLLSPAASRRLRVNGRVRRSHLSRQQAAQLSPPRHSSSAPRSHRDSAAADPQQPLLLLLPPPRVHAPPSPHESAHSPPRWRRACAQAQRPPCTTGNVVLGTRGGAFVLCTSKSSQGRAGAVTGLSCTRS